MVIADVLLVVAPPGNQTVCDEPQQRGHREQGKHGAESNWDEALFVDGGQWVQAVWKLEVALLERPPHYSGCHIEGHHAAADAR